LAGTPVSAEDTTNSKTVRHILQKMKDDITSIYPNFNDKTILWSRPIAWKLVESVVKEPGKVWRQKIPHEYPKAAGLTFVGDSTIGYGIGTDSAAHSSLLCYPRLINYLRGIEDKGYLREINTKPS
jgi:hypothetical protein